MALGEKYGHIRLFQQGDNVEFMRILLRSSSIHVFRGPYYEIVPVYVIGINGRSRVGVLVISWIPFQTDLICPCSKTDKPV